MSGTGTFQNRWWAVVASVLALMVGSGVINIFVFATFLKPVSEALGLSRGTLSGALLFATFVNAFGLGLFGIVTDKFPIRTLLLCAITLYALAVAGLSLLQPDLAIVYLLFGLTGFLGAAQSPIGYSKVISQWFDKDRGLALGIAQAGTGAGGFVVPQIAGLLIAGLGWRMAYVGVGAIVFLLAFLPVALFLKEPSAAARRAAAELARAQNSVLPGVSIEEARRSWQFWALALALFFGGLVANGMLSHSVALLTDRGISVPVAITVLSIGGIAMLIGRVLAGWCLDLFFAPTVAICIFLIPMVGIALIASGATGIFPMLGIICCGVCLGAEGDLMPYFVGRYFGLRSFGQIYGYIMAIFVLGIGVGPLVMGLAFDYAHSYMAGFVIFEAALVITCLLFTRLGPYRFPVARRAPDAVPPGAAVQP